MALAEQRLDITPLRAFRDNYIWMVRSGTFTCVVDPGDASPVLEKLEAMGVDLDEVWITHHHPDHVGGVAALKKIFPALVVRGGVGGPPFIDESHRDADIFQPGMPGHTVEVWEVPGHTTDHLAFILHGHDHQRHVFCGDTLFSGGCGRLFGGTAQQLHDSLLRLAGLHPDTLFYPAHEYTLSNLRFGHHLEPGNDRLHSLLTAFEADPDSHVPSLPTTLGKEMEINPFIRAVNGSFDTSVLRAFGELPSNSIDLFAILRKMKDSF